MKISNPPAFSDLMSRLMTALVVLIVTVSCGSEDNGPAREPVVRPVKLMTLSPASDVQTARYPGIVDASRFSELSFQVSGLIEELAVVEAQQVAEGDLIARLDQRDFQSQAQAALAQFQNAEEEFQRAVRLANEDAIARSVLEQRQTQRDVARAQHDSAEKALEDSVIRAPFAGVVAQISVRESESVAAGRMVAALMGQGALEVEIDVPAKVITESLEVENRGAFVILEAAPDNRFEATFKEADLLADTASQTYSVTFTFSPPDNLVILPGMNVTVELTEARRLETGDTSRTAVPLSAIASDGAGTYVWVVDQDTMTVSRRDVTVADGIGETALVTEGLSMGEIIATAGASYLADGMQVRPWTE